MKVLLVSEDLPAPQLGGAGKHAVLLGNALLEAGHHVEMLGQTRAPGVETTNGFAGRIRADIDLSHTGAKEQALGVFHALRRLHIAHRLWGAIRRCGPDWDVIHYHGHIPLLGALVPAGINFVHTLHDQGSECIIKIRFRDNEPCRARNPAICAGCATLRPNVLQTYVSAHAVRSLRGMARTAFTRHQAIFVSQFLENRFREIVGPAPLRAHVVHNFIDSSQVRRALQNTERASASSDGRPKVFLAGRMDRAKGFSAFFDAMPDGLLQRLNVSVAGDGPDLPELQQRHAGRGVHFLGWRDLDSVLLAAARADACVVPSVWEEPCGTTVLESLALGRPVFALARGGTPELVAYQQHPGQLRLFDQMQDLVAALGTAESIAPAIAVDGRSDVRARLPAILDVYESGRVSACTETGRRA